LDVGNPVPQTGKFQDWDSCRQYDWGKGLPGEPFRFQIGGLRP
jgi:hypothetical protein